MHIQNLAILKGLVSVAWVDGRVTSEESEVIEALLRAFGASPSERREIEQFAAVPRSLSDVPLHELSGDDRRVLLQHSVLLAFADGEQHAQEAQWIAELCRVLRIPKIESQGLIGAAEERARELTRLL